MPESCGLDESSEDSEDRDHAVPFSSSSCRRNMFYERKKYTPGHTRETQGGGKIWGLHFDSHKRPVPEARVCLVGSGYRWKIAW